MPFEIDVLSMIYCIFFYWFKNFSNWINNTIIFFGSPWHNGTVYVLNISLSFPTFNWISEDINYKQALINFDVTLYNKSPDDTFQLLIRQSYSRIFANVDFKYTMKMAFCALHTQKKLYFYT